MCVFFAPSFGKQESKLFRPFITSPIELIKPAFFVRRCLQKPMSVTKGNIVDIRLTVIVAVADGAVWGAHLVRVEP